MKKILAVSALVCGLLLAAQAGSALAPPEDAWRPSASQAADPALPQAFASYDFQEIRLYSQGTQSFTRLDKPNRIRFSAAWADLKPVPGGELGDPLPGIARAVLLPDAPDPVWQRCSLYENGVSIEWDAPDGTPSAASFTFDRREYQTFLTRLRTIFDYGDKQPAAFDGLSGGDAITQALGRVYILPQSYRRVTRERETLPGAVRAEIRAAEGPVTVWYNAGEILIRPGGGRDGARYRFAEGGGDSLSFPS